MGYLLRENVIQIDLGDILLLSLGENKVVQLSDTSRTIYELALAFDNINEIVEQICKEYSVEIEREQLQEDIKECIDMLIDNEILVISDK